MRRSLTRRINQFLQQGERQLIRIIVLGSVILVVMQFSSARDPVQFYLAFAQEVESPSLELNTSGQAMTIPTSSQSPLFSSVSSTDQTRVYQITLKSTPNSAVRVLQNGKVLGTLAKGQQVFSVHTGTVQLDATNVTQSVRVQVVKRDALLNQPTQNQFLLNNGKVYEIWVGP